MRINPICNKTGLNCKFMKSIKYNEYSSIVILAWGFGWC